MAPLNALLGLHQQASLSFDELDSIARLCPTANLTVNTRTQRRAITRELAHFAIQSRYDSLPREVQAEAVRTLVNWVGCVLGGCSDPSVIIAENTVRQFGGAPQASVLGRGLRTDVASAAFVNCVSSSCYAFDDAHLPTVAHPSSPAGSALLALAETQAVSGEAFLNALALSIEIQCRLSNAIAMPPSKFNPGFFMTGLSGPIGVAMGVGILLKLNEEQMATAIVLAASQSSGFRATNGTMSANFRPAHVSRCGIWAAVSAAHGFTSDDDALEAEHGFFAVFAPDADPGKALDGLGHTFELFSNAYKPYPCGVVIHPAIDACLEALQGAAPRARPCGAVLRVHPFALTLCNLRTPSTPREAVVSLYHWVSASLLRGTAGLAESSQNCIDDPDVAALRSRIEAIADTSLGREQAIAEVTFDNGQVLRAHVTHVRGSIERPLTDAELDRKFREQSSSVLPESKVHALLGVCRGIANSPDVGLHIVDAANAHLTSAKQ